MPWQKVLDKFDRGELHSGSKTGPRVTNRKQAIAIMMSEKEKGTHSSAGSTPKRKRKRTIGDYLGD